MDFQFRCWRPARRPRVWPSWVSQALPVPKRITDGASPTCTVLWLAAKMVVKCFEQMFRQTFKTKKDWKPNSGVLNFSNRFQCVCFMSFCDVFWCFIQRSSNPLAAAIASELHSPLSYLKCCQRFWDLWCLDVKILLWWFFWFRRNWLYGPTFQPCIYVVHVSSESCCRHEPSSTLFFENQGLPNIFIKQKSDKHQKSPYMITWWLETRRGAHLTNAYRPKVTNTMEEKPEVAMGTAQKNDRWGNLPTTLHQSCEVFMTGRKFDVLMCHWKVLKIAVKVERSTGSLTLWLFVVGKVKNTFNAAKQKEIKNYVATLFQQILPEQLPDQSQVMKISHNGWFDPQLFGVQGCDFSKPKFVETQVICERYSEIINKLKKTRWSPRTRMPTRMLRNKGLILICHNFQRTHLWNTLIWHTEVTLL